MSKSTKKVWTIKDKVAYFLEKSVRARNDDKFLTLLYWKYADKLNMDDLANEYLERGTPATSIIRARCLIQSEGLYLPNPEVAKRRGLKEKAFRRTIYNEGQVPSEADVANYVDDDESEY